MRVEAVVILVTVVWQLLQIIMTAEGGGRIAKPGCQDKCGNASIPYPFGIGRNCYHNPWFEVECNNHQGNLSFNKKVSNYSSLEGWRSRISWEHRSVIVPTPCRGLAKSEAYSDEIIFDNDYGGSALRPIPNLEGTPFKFSSNWNVLLVSGCGGAAVLADRHNRTLAGCAAICINGSKPGMDCHGVGCCQTTISHSVDYYNYGFSAMGDMIWTYAVLVDSHWILNKSKDLLSDEDGLCHPAQVVLQWTVTDLPIHSASYANSSCVNKTATAHDSGGLVCRCKNEFYQGNPYLPHGCQVVKECESCAQDCILLRNHTFGCPEKEKDKGKSSTLLIVVGIGLSTGLMVALLGAYWLYHMMKRKRILKLKAMYFKRNGGLLLKQQISSHEDNNIEKIKIFNSEELDKATDQYNEDRILGQGGQGTVYKGMLSDGKIVAIKKSRMVKESQLSVFINEVMLLSQINHRNIVNLLGCCLETEVPILVYEYVPSGTLSQHIHARTNDFPIAWEMRLQIATDIANALAYLHSSYMVPIFHRDIKSSNILLDEKYRAKLSDFGISKSVNIDQTHVTTDVVGTFGYLDPEYFQSSQFTDKSDVYSFAVVLVELLTGEKAIRSEEDEERGLAAWFLGNIGDSKLYEILDARVVREGREAEIMAVAHLARRCLNLNGKRRPTMKEVAAELETVRSSLKQGLTRGLSLSSTMSDESSFSNIAISLED